VVREQREVGVAHLLDRLRRRVRVADVAFVLVDEDELAAASRRGLVVDRRHALHVGPHRAPARVVVERPPDPGPGLVQLQVQRDAERCRPVALEHVALEVDANHVVGAELLPREEPRVAQEGAVALVDGDVAGEVVVVPLVPQCARQQHDLLALGELGAEPVGSGLERHLSRP